MATDEITSIELRVDELDAGRTFYRDIVGLRIHSQTDGRVEFGPPDGDEPVVALVESPDAQPRSSQEAGLFHLAIRYPSRMDLAHALGRMGQKSYPMAGASDHDVSEALYTRDPAGNGVELYVDRPRSEWRREDNGEVVMTTERLDVDELRGLAGASPDSHAPAGTDLGHVHLEVTELEGAVDFYSNVLGMNVQTTRRGAAFLSWGGYHHHVGLNTWSRRTQPHRPDSLGLSTLHATVADDVAAKVRSRADDVGLDVETDDRLRLSDPDGMTWQIRVDAT